jgi:hypothetical protein
MVCEELEQLQWDFIQARAGSPHSTWDKPRGGLTP